MKDFTNAPILDPDNYNPNDYEKGQLVKYQDGGNLLNVTITDVDYIGGGIAVEFDNGDDEKIEL